MRYSPPRSRALSRSVASTLRDMTIDDIVALIVGTDYDDVKETRQSRSRCRPSTRAECD